MAVVSPLEQLGEPLFYYVDDNAVEPPSTELDAAQRVHVRTLEGMQKEAVIADSRSDGAWRLASDEGDYLDGDDVAPCPLSFFLTGLVSSAVNGIEEFADERDVLIDDVEIVLDTFYTMQGSALRGDMTGGALPPEFGVTVAGEADASTVETLVEDAITSAPVMGLVYDEHTSLFNLALNGEELEPEGVGPLNAPITSDPLDTFEYLPRDPSSQSEPVVRHTGRKTEEYPEDREDYTAGEGSSLQEEQDRVLHLRATCDVRDDGLKEITQRIYSPRGSIFRALSDEPVGHGGEGRAPDAMTYAAAGIAFCFMTQFGRYADIVDKDLDAYRVVQNTAFGTPAEARPVETDVFLESPEAKDFAQGILEMSEQTCFLHALCRTPLEPEIDVTVS